MTPHAIRQFIAICGGDYIAKGSRVVEPERGYTHPSYCMGQTDHIAHTLRFGPVFIACPFELETEDAQLWAAARLRERKEEYSAVEALSRAKERGL